MVKGKANQLQAWTGPEDSRRLRHSAHEGVKVVSLTHWPPLTPRKYCCCSFLLEGESTPGPLCGRKNYVNENSSDTIEIRNHDLPACNSVPQPAAPPRALWSEYKLQIIVLFCTINLYSVLDETFFNIRKKISRQRLMLILKFALLYRKSLCTSQHF